MSEYFVDKAEEISEGDFETDNDILYIISTIDECYELGMKILTFNYGEEADELFEKEGSMIWLSNDISDSNYKKWVKLSNKAEKDRVLDIKKFFSIIANNVNNWWL